VALDLECFNELFENVRAGPHSHRAWTLERTALLPFVNAFLAKHFAAIVALVRIRRNFEANTTYELIF
jgi:hypothetical protein